MITHHFLIQTSSEINYETKYKLVNALLENIAKSNPKYKDSKIGVAKFTVGIDENQAKQDFVLFIQDNGITPSRDDVLMNLKGEDFDSDGIKYQWHMIILFIPKSVKADGIGGAKGRGIEMLKPIGKLFQKKSNSGVLDDYLKWRSIIFSTNDPQAETTNDRPNRVYGVIMDVGLSDDFTITITAFSAGMSSLITTLGGGTIYLNDDESIMQQAKHVVTLAQSLIKTAHPIKNHNLPKSDEVYFYFLTTSGLMISETTVEETSNPNHPFHEMFGRFTEIKSRSEELKMAHRR